MLHIEFQVEEPSMAITLEEIAQKILRDQATYQVNDHGSKNRLLGNLPSRLRAYKRIAQAMDLAVVVLIDEDRQDCRDLKLRLENMAQMAGLATKSQPNGRGRFQIVNRVVVEELEAWYFGDCEALRQVYPRLPNHLEAKAKFRDPDAIKGGTWEALHRELKKAGHLGSVFPKREIARLVSPLMVPSRNRSRSFRVFVEGIEALVA